MICSTKSALAAENNNVSASFDLGVSDFTKVLISSPSLVEPGSRNTSTVLPASSNFF